MCLEVVSYSSLEMPSAERVGSNIKLWRGRRRMTQAQLGELIGSDGPRVGRLESGKENPTLETLDKLAVALEIDVHYLTAPRPEEETGHVDASGSRTGSALLEGIVEALDGEVPAEDTWRGD